ncbi:MAG: Glu/Leu/Phe/Val dehydrogenase dimerization domain-containing protein [Clostridiales bacterium]|nr:Glu/Leu/Phe/Val dehydrogenase dimerization domain-containing protein [Clostridiales bacterium]
MRSLTTPLKDKGFTTLKIRYNYKTDVFRMEALKQWEQDLDFSRYNKDFYVESILTDDVQYLNTRQVRELYRAYDLEDYLDEILDLIRQGRHFGIELYYNDKLNITYMSHQHSRKLGINNKLHATLAGGIRRHSPEEEEKEVIIDGLNLGRGMSFKNVAGHLAFGGCKQTVTMEPLDLTNMEIMGFLGFCIDSCRTMTGPDMNFPTEMADVENENFSMNYTNGPNSPLGETGKPTAYGIYVTLKQAVRFKEKQDSLDGKSIMLVGLGAVGWYMGEYLLQEDVKLKITDINMDVAKRFIEEHPGRNIEIVPLENAYYEDVDILCPCAIGGIFYDENIPKLRCQYIWGSANNQLRASSQEEEIRLSKLLAERDILFQTEWWHNTAGVICGAQEYLYGKNATYENLIKTIDETMPQSTYDNLVEAQEKGITPCENVYRKCESIIYGDN